MQSDGQASVGNGTSVLNEALGRKHHLCNTDYPVTGPDPSLDFISLYGLGPVATSVARNDPYTGEKINRLRKSYKGKIKEYGLSGRNDAVKHEPGAPGRLLDLSAWPEDEWFNQKVYGKEMKVADPGSDLERIQLKAMRSAPGILPDNDVWEDALGHEKPVKSADALKFSAAPRQVSNASVSSAAPSPTTTDYASTRPKRTGKKRSYHDSSFIGYGEGFADDDGNSVQSTDESGKTGKKKRRKDRERLPSVSYPTVEKAGGSYGVGMFNYGPR